MIFNMLHRIKLFCLILMINYLSIFNTWAENQSNKLKTELEYIVTNFPHRDHTHPQELKSLADYIAQKFRSKTVQAIKDNVSFQIFNVNNNNFYNVISKYGPDTSKKIIIGAHYDTAGDSPGADDNTSGIVGLISLSNKLQNLKLSHRVELVAFSLEEPPYFATEQMGSAVHAKSLKENNLNVIAMISLEMIGYFSNTENSQEFPNPELRKIFPSTGNFISVVGKTGEEKLTHCIRATMSKDTKLKVYSFNGPWQMKGIGFSDHLSYWRYEYPAAMITDTAFYRNKNYHTKNDLPNTLNYVKMSEVIDALYNVIIALDTGCNDF